jgi:DNA-directed RNA polymerase subunit RPC12/RpoP
MKNSSSFRCEACGSSNIRRSRRKSFAEMARMAIGQYPFRCLDCHHRFLLNVWLFAKLRYAKCPRCLGPELTTWPARRRARVRYQILVVFGAHRYRCSGCRKNFVSFLPRQDAAAEQVLGEIGVKR